MAEEKKRVVPSKGPSSTTTRDKTLGRLNESHREQPYSVSNTLKPPKPEGGSGNNNKK